MDRTGQLVATVGEQPHFDPTAFATLTAADFSANDQLARLIGETDFNSGPSTLHPKAIYLVEGRLFQVETLDVEGRKAYVRSVEYRLSGALQIAYLNAWLTAHPDPAAYVLSTSIDDARADGVAKALTQSSREGYAVGLGCDDIGQASTKASAASQNHFLGCVAYFPEKYPDYAISIAADIAEGKPVPQEVHLEHVFYDASTIGTVYP